jgi:hypothetical protein
MHTSSPERRLATAAVTVVAAIAVVISFMHIYSLSVHLGQTRLAAALMPISIDGAIAAASASLLAAARRKSRTPLLAQALLALGVLATLAANAFSGLGRGPAGMVLACWPAIAFVASTETVLAMIRQSGDEKDAAAQAAERAARPQTGKRAATASRKIKRTGTLLAADPSMSTADLSRRLGVTQATAKKYREAAVERELAAITE